VKCRHRKIAPPKRRSRICSPFLLANGRIAPKVIVCLGSVAAQTLLETNRAFLSSAGNGSIFADESSWPRITRPICCAPQRKGEVWKDLQKVMAVLGLQGKNPHRPALVNPRQAFLIHHGNLLGVLTALTWGGSDSSRAFATERMGTLRTLLYMQFIGSSCSPSRSHGSAAGPPRRRFRLAPWAGEPLPDASTPSPRSVSTVPLKSEKWPWSPTLRELSGFDRYAVAPFRERLSAARAIGIACTMLGVLLVAAGEKRGRQRCRSHAAQRQRNRLGARFSGRIGLLFWLLGNRVIPRVGAPQTCEIRMTCTVIAAAVILVSAADKAAAQHARISLGMGLETPRLRV